ncbi:MFS transporter [Algiphilus aromaticivorans]|uniref:MFS transporter n=1 Tax=Algiphilus aromaticivorans TaxID=382454 RepID=UPI000693F59F|nr:MFS transporter [Algiphilus aromaticivorans]
MPLLSRPLTLLLCSTLTVMAAATITPTLSAIAAHFAETPHAEFLTRLVLTLPALIIVLVAPLAGRACDTRGRRPVLLFGLALYVLGGSLGALAPSLELLLASRALLGVGIGCLMTATTTMIADGSRDAEQARLLGLQGAFMAGGGVVFVFAGGLAAEIHWRVAFGIYLLALLLLPAILRLPESRPERSAEDDAARAAPPSRLLRQVGSLCVLAFLGMGLFYLTPVYMPFLLSERFAASSGWVGAAMALFNIAAMVAGTLFGRVRGRVPPLGMVTITAGLLGLGYAVVSHATGVPLFVAGLLLAGFGLGFMIPNLNQWAVNRSEAALRGRALGWMTTAFFLGQFASPLLAQPVAVGLGYGGLYGAAAAVLGAGALAAALAVAASWRSSQRLRSRPPP